MTSKPHGGSGANRLEGLRGSEAAPGEEVAFQAQKALPEPAPQDERLAGRAGACSGD